MAGFVKSVIDPKNSALPVVVEALPNTTDGFVWWNCESREVLERHETRQGIQLVLA